MFPRRTLVLLNCVLVLMMAWSVWAGDPVVTREFIYKEAPFRSCYACTTEETPKGVVAAWFGGTSEGNDDVTIWVSRRINGKWSDPKEAANGIQVDGGRHPCWNPVLFQVPGGELILFYKVGPSPSRWWGELKRSRDHGQSWSAAERLPDGILGPVKDKAVLARDGKTLLCPSSTEHAGWRVHLETTVDWGKTWKRTEALNTRDEFVAIQPTLIPWSGVRMPRAAASNAWRPSLSCAAAS